LLLLPYLHYTIRIRRFVVLFRSQSAIMNRSFMLSFAPFIVLLLIHYLNHNMSQLWMLFIETIIASNSEMDFPHPASAIPKPNKQTMQISSQRPNIFISTQQTEQTTADMTITPSKQKNKLASRIFKHREPSPEELARLKALKPDIIINRTPPPKQLIPEDPATQIYKVNPSQRSKSWLLLSILTPSYTNDFSLFISVNRARVSVLDGSLTVPAMGIVRLPVHIDPEDPKKVAEIEIKHCLFIPKAVCSGFNPLSVQFAKEVRINSGDATFGTEDKEGKTIWFAEEWCGVNRLASCGREDEDNEMVKNLVKRGLRGDLMMTAMERERWLGEKWRVKLSEVRKRRRERKERKRSALKNEI